MTTEAKQTNEIHDKKSQRSIFNVLRNLLAIAIATVIAVSVLGILAINTEKTSSWLSEASGKTAVVAGLLGVVLFIREIYNIPGVKRIVNKLRGRGETCEWQ